MELAPAVPRAVPNHKFSAPRAAEILAQIDKPVAVGRDVLQRERAEADGGDAHPAEIGPPDRAVRHAHVRVKTGEGAVLDQDLAAVVRADQSPISAVGDVRGLGGMIGLELVKDQESKEPDAPLTAALIQECAKNGLLIENAGTYGNVVRFLGPLVMTDEQLEAGLEIMEKALVKCMEEE